MAELDVQAEKNRVSREYEVRLRAIKAKREKLSTKEKELKKEFSIKLSYLDSFEKRHGGNGHSKPTTTGKKRTIKDKILDALKQKPMTNRQIAKFTGCKVNSVQKYLRDLKEEGKVIKFGTKGNGRKKRAVYSLKK